MASTAVVAATAAAAAAAAVEVVAVTGKEAADWGEAAERVARVWVVNTAAA